MRRAFRAWPFVVAILCLIYDTKWVLVILITADAEPLWLYGFPMSTAVLELLYWNWFMGWFPHWAKEQDKARDTFREFWDDGFGARITRLWPKLPRSSQPGPCPGPKGYWPRTRTGTVSPTISKQCAALGCRNDRTALSRHRRYGCGGVLAPDGGG